MILDTGNWARCAAEENFDLNVNGCWNLNPYKDEFRVDLFKAEGAHGPKWIHEQIQYTPQDPNYELWFVAQSEPTNADSGDSGDIAIDDISAYYGECQQQNVCTFEDSKACLRLQSGELGPHRLDNRELCQRSNWISSACRSHIRWTSWKNSLLPERGWDQWKL